MGQKIKKLKKIRLHREGTDQLVYGIIAIVAIAVILWYTFDNKIPFWIFSVVFGVVYCIVLIRSHRAQFLSLPDTLLECRGHREFGGSSCRRQDCGHRGS